MHAPQRPTARASVWKSSLCGNRRVINEGDAMTTSGVTRPPGQPSSAGEAAQSVASTAKDEGRAVAATARDETARLASEARNELRKHGDEQSRRLAERVRDLGSQLDGVRRGEAP